MNVLIITTYKLLPIKNAGQKGIVLFAEALSKNANVFLITTKDNPINHKYNFNLLQILSKKFWIKYTNILYFFKILKIAKKHKITNIIFEQPYLPFIFILLKIFTKYKCGFYSRNIEFTRFKSYNKLVWIPLFIAEFLFYKFSAFVFFVSPEDKNFAKKTFKLKDTKCFYLPHCIEIKEPPIDKIECSNTLRKLYKINKNENLLFFNGALNYEPNVNALKKIIDFIIPELNNNNFLYKIIICGSNLPKHFDEFKKNKEIIYASFVDDISIYNKGVDVFINPVIEGGGVKVKLLEALSYNVNCVSTQSGANGLSLDVCLNKLKIVNDNNWKDFATQIIESSKNKDENINKNFYELYYCENIGKRAINLLLK